MDRKEWLETIEEIKSGDRDAEIRLWDAYQFAVHEQSVLEQVRQSKEARLKSKPVSIEPIEDREDATLVDDCPPGFEAVVEQNSRMRALLIRARDERLDQAEIDEVLEVLSGKDER